MFESLAQVISKQMYVGQTFKINNSGVQVDLARDIVSNLNKTKSLSDSQIIIKSFCELLSSSSCQSSVVSKKVLLFIVS